MELRAYHPRSRLVTKTTRVERPRFSVIDAHNHLELLGGDWVHKPFSALTDAMDEAGVRALVDLDGAWGEDMVNRHLDLFKARAPERFAIFGGIDWEAWPEHGNQFGEWAAGRLRAQARRGAEGLKVWKNLGLHVRDEQGQRVRVNDPRLEPIWQTAQELKLPVTLHIADPVAFFDPLDETNERWEELGENPDWHFPAPPFPPFLSLMEDMLAVVAKHPQVTFIGAHAGCYAEDLGWVAQACQRCPNFFIDISARVAELGRQPYTARRFFIDYSDRILFGLDAVIEAPRYQVYYRFLETDDEYFSYSPNGTPRNGRWNIYGIDLPDDVLQKVYAGNAERLIFNTEERSNA